MAGTRKMVRHRDTTQRVAHDQQDVHVLLPLTRGGSRGEISSNGPDLKGIGAVLMSANDFNHQMRFAPRRRLPDRRAGAWVRPFGMADLAADMNAAEKNAVVYGRCITWMKALLV